MVGIERIIRGENPRRLRLPDALMSEGHGSDGFKGQFFAFGSFHETRDALRLQVLGLPKSNPFTRLTNLRRKCEFLVHMWFTSPHFIVKTQAVGLYRVGWRLSGSPFSRNKRPLSAFNHWRARRHGTAILYPRSRWSLVVGEGFKIILFEKNFQFMLMQTITVHNDGKK